MVAAKDVGRPPVRSLRIGPLLVAIAICVLFALFGSALVGESLGTWYDTLDKPWFLVPLWAFYIVGWRTRYVWNLGTCVRDNGGC